MDDEISAIAVQTQQTLRVLPPQTLTLTPVQLVARRLGDLAWFFAHAVAVATITALGAVAVLAAVTLFCVAAPAFGVVVLSAMHRHDARLASAPLA